MDPFILSYSVSIIVPTYNRSALLAHTLHSLVGQQFDPATMEVLVIDDGSSDDSYEVVTRFLPLLNLRYFYQEDKGYRVASARNMGIRHAQGEILLFVDSGVLLGSQAVQAHWEYHQSLLSPVALIGYVYGFEQHNDHARELLQLINPREPDETIRRFATQQTHLDIRERAYQACQDRIEQLPAPWVFFWTCHVSARRDSVREVGAFDEQFDLRWGVEDQELGLRLHQRGVPIRLLRKAAAIHYPHPKDEEENRAQDQVNRQYLHQKHQRIETELYLHCDDFELNEKISQHYQAHQGSLQPELK